MRDDETGTGASGELWRLSAADLRRGYQRRSFSPTEVVTDLVNRIDRINPRLNAYLAVDVEGALADAADATSCWLRAGDKPLLCGVPVSLKDTIEMAGLPTTYGSLVFKGNVRPDSEIAIRLRRAGAVLIGKTNTPEFALRGTTTNRLGPEAVNAWDQSRTAGGSSGGAAAAVAAGLGPIAIGTDSGGSIRGPSAYNGVFGFKPTYQRIPAVQAWRAAQGRSHNGPITRTVEDSALVMEAIAGPDHRDPDSLLTPAETYLAYRLGTIRGARVAMSDNFGFAPPLTSEAAKTFQNAADLLRDAGCRVRRSDPPSLEADDEVEAGAWAYASDHYGAAADLIPDFWEKHCDDLTDYARPIYDAGRTVPAWKFRRITLRNSRYVAALDEWFGDHDFLLAPATPVAPVAGTAADKIAGVREMGHLVAFSVGHHPAAAVPMGRSAEGLPLAVQIVGRLGDDVGVLRVARAMEAAHPWADDWPPVANLGT